MKATTIVVVCAALIAGACGKSENAGVEAAKRQAEAEERAKGPVEVAKKISPPVPGHAKLTCEQLFDPAKVQTALGEKEPVTIAKAAQPDPEAAASCSIIRGGKPLSDAEQKAAIKKDGKLGVMAGEELCKVLTFCWTIEDADNFKKRCAQRKEKDDDSLGFYACVLIVAQGADDVKRFRFFDDDTKCIIQVSGGPSNVDNDLIGKCASAAHDMIGPDQIKVGAPPASGAAGSAAP